MSYGSSILEVSRQLGIYSRTHPEGDPLSAGRYLSPAAVGYGPHRTIYLIGIDREGFRAQAVQDSELTALRPYGSVHVGPGWPWIPTAPVDTREDNR